MKQLRDILFLQTFGIILVVLGHSFYQFPSDTPFIRWIYGFHMPLFFFISGYLLKYVHGDLAHLQLSGRTGYMARKARRLLVPYVVISSLFFVPKALMSRYSVRPIQLNLHDYLDQLLIPYHNVFGAYWFMPTLFLVFIVFILARKTLGRHATTTGGMVALGALGVVDCLMPSQRTACSTSSAWCSTCSISPWATSTKRRAWKRPSKKPMPRWFSSRHWLCLSY